MMMMVTKREMQREMQRRLKSLLKKIRYSNQRRARQQSLPRRMRHHSLRRRDNRRSLRENLRISFRVGDRAREVRMCQRVGGRSR